MEEKTVTELLKIITNMNETINEQFQTILWLNRYIRNLEEQNERYKRFRPFGE